MYILIKDSAIFTDAVNNTGLATITYRNASGQQVCRAKPRSRLASDIDLKKSIFYVARTDDGVPVLREKRNFTTTDGWEVGSMSRTDSYRVGDSKAANGGHCYYRMAAVYSENFINGKRLPAFLPQER